MFQALNLNSHVGLKLWSTRSAT